MTLCTAEIMKRIKALSEEKEDLISYEDTNCTVSYKETETPAPDPYDYHETREKIAEIDREVLRLRFLLAQANCVTPLDGFDMTVAQALIALAQMQNALAQLESMTRRNQKSRRITQTGVLEYTECRYDVAAVREEARALRQTIAALQVAIDRANLTNAVEV